MTSSENQVSDVFWSPLNVCSGCVNAGRVPIKKVERVPSSSAVSRNHNQRHSRFLALYEALQSLSKLSKEDSFYLPEHVAERAISFVGMISSNLKIDAPRFFPQDREVAVFTWDDGTIKRLLTLDEEEIDIIDVNKSTFVKCSYAFPAGEGVDYAYILSEMRNYASTSSSSCLND